jgi:hypothetical protein
MDTVSSLEAQGLRSLTQGHPKCEAGFLRRRSDLNCAAVRLGNLRGNVQTETEALLAWVARLLEEGLEKPLHGLRRDGLADVGDRLLSSPPWSQPAAAPARPARRE